VKKNVGAIKTAWPADHVERRSVESLIPYARNARTHSDEQVAQIAASIKEWGWTTPVLVDENGQIIAGHGRVMAARKLGIEEVPVMIARGWTEAQRRAYVLADNKLALNSGWDDQLLKIELDSLKTEGFDMDLLGWDVLPEFEAVPDYSILDEEDVSSKMDEMSDGVKKAIQIEFEPEHYEEAFELIKFWRQKEMYIGDFLIQKLKEEKAKL
tara:strand:- start:2336 stop:2971 length:636 start_codon:yes stop_codon:yes gene_type:complete